MSTLNDVPGGKLDAISLIPEVSLANGSDQVTDKDCVPYSTDWVIFSGHSITGGVSSA